MTKKAYVYVLTHRITGRFYIGSTNKPYLREKGHLSNLRRGVHANLGMQECYDVDPTFDLVVHAMADREVAFNVEHALIKLLKNDSRILNRHGAIDHWTEDKRRVLSDKKKGIPKTIEARKRMSISKMGIGHSAKTREKMSATRTGRKYSDEWKQNISKGLAHPIMGDGIKYESAQAAGRALRLDGSTIYERLESQSPKWVGWYRLYEKVNRK